MWCVCAQEKKWGIFVQFPKMQHNTNDSWQNQQSDICPVWSESSQCAQWVAKDPWFLHAVSKSSDQTGLMPGWSESSLCTHATLLVLSRRLKYAIIPTFTANHKSSLILVVWQPSGISVTSVTVETALTFVSVLIRGMYWLRFVEVDFIYTETRHSQHLQKDVCMKWSFGSACTFSVWSQSAFTQTDQRLLST